MAIHYCNVIMDHAFRFQEIESIIRDALIQCTHPPTCIHYNAIPPILFKINNCFLIRNCINAD